MDGRANGWPDGGKTGWRMATATWMAWRRHTAWRQFPAMKITAAECICWAYACPHLPFMPKQLPCCIALRVYSWTPQPRCVLYWHVVPLLPIKGPVSTYTKVELDVQRVEVTQSYNALMQATKHSPLMLGCTAEDNGHAWPNCHMCFYSS